VRDGAARGIDKIELHIAEEFFALRLGTGKMRNSRLIALRTYQISIHTHHYHLYIALHGQLLVQVISIQVSA